MMNDETPEGLSKSVKHTKKAKCIGIWWKEQSRKALSTYEELMC